MDYVIDIVFIKKEIYVYQNSMGILGFDYFLYGKTYLLEGTVKINCRTRPIRFCCTT